jgi:cytidylate kinase
VVVTIDGPAGAGKSTVARGLAAALGYEYLDTGALYRAVTHAALARGVDLEDEAALAGFARGLALELKEGGERVLCDGEDVSEAIRRPEVTRNIWRVADRPGVRRVLGELARGWARGRDVVTEGRDQGSEVFPGAAVKFYLDAPVEVRAARRLKDYRAAGHEATEAEVEEEVRERDARDRSRPVGALRVPEGAEVVDTSGMTVAEVVAHLARRVRERGGLGGARE